MVWATLSQSNKPISTAWCGLLWGCDWDNGNTAGKSFVCLWHEGEDSQDQGRPVTAARCFPGRKHDNWEQLAGIQPEALSHAPPLHIWLAWDSYSSTSLKDFVSLDHTVIRSHSRLSCHDRQVRSKQSPPHFNLFFPH